MTKIYKPATLAIIEHDDTLRQTMLAFFTSNIDIRHVWAVPTVSDLIDNPRRYPSPDIVLLDIDLPDKSDISAIRVVKSTFADVRVIMMFPELNTGNIYKALCAGAAGYILKSADLPELKRAVMEVRYGESYICPSIASKIVEYFAPTEESKRDYRLTVREDQVVECIVDGLSYKMIADRLSIKIETVRGYIKNIYRKLEVNSKIEVVKKVNRGEI
jgi:DNA-binding NarL/FixJ family response regulator